MKRWIVERGLEILFAPLLWVDLFSVTSDRHENAVHSAMERIFRKSLPKMRLLR